MSQLVRIVAPHFVAGIVVEDVFANDRCIDAAPILAWCKGKTNEELRGYFSRKGWKASVVPQRTERT